jgi:hypothetical protein
MKTHCDLVTEVRPGSLTVVGGNVNNSVARKTRRTDARGRITEPNYFAVISMFFIFTCSKKFERRRNWRDPDAFIVAT